jgi:hypothetical protein
LRSLKIGPKWKNLGSSVPIKRHCPTRKNFFTWNEK